jgi:gluconolactonase
VTAIKNDSLSDGRTPNGGTYFERLAYFTTLGNKSIAQAPGIFSVNTTSFAATPILNSYYGVHINSANDLTWVPSSVCPEASLFFTSFDLGPFGDPGASTAVLPNAVFRFTPHSKSLRAVISRNDVLAPNGISRDPSSRYLYVTDVSATRVAGAGALNSASVAIYRFTLDEACNPTNKVMFAMPRSGLADGIHVDDFGRVWTAEYNGIVVRGKDGRELGVFNSEWLNDQQIPIANFALAGDKLVVGAYDRFWVVQLGQNVTGTV